MEFRGGCWDGCWLEQLPCKQKLWGQGSSSLEQRQLQGQLTAAPSTLQGREDGGDGAGLFAVVHSRRMRDTGHELNEAILIDVRSNFFPMRAPKRNRLPRETVHSLSLEIFKTWLGKALHNLIWFHAWQCFEQEIGPETSQGPFQPELFRDSDNACCWGHISSFWSDVRSPPNFATCKDEVPSSSNLFIGLAPYEYCMARQHASLLADHISLCCLHGFCLELKHVIRGLFIWHKLLRNASKKLTGSMYVKCTHECSKL